MKTKILALAISTTLSASVAVSQLTVQTPVAGATPVVIPGIVQDATVPRVISTQPANGDTRVNPNLRAIRITFSEPMDVATFYWPLPLGQQGFPTVTGDPVWENNNQTIVLPVRLAPNTVYRIPINAGNQAIFRSAKGLTAYPGQIAFQTLEGSTGSVPTSLAPNANVPRGFRGTGASPSNTPPPYRDPGVFGSSQSRNTPMPSTGIPRVQTSPQATNAPAIPQSGIAAGSRTRIKTPRSNTTSVQQTPRR